MSDLNPTAFTFTDKEIHDCAGKIVKQAKEIFNAAPVTARVWSFRHDGYEMISCDLSDQGETKWMPIVITATGEQMLEIIDEPEVFDMTEALHLAGLIVRAMDAKVIVGRGQNEINPEVLAKPLIGRETNGKINLWKQEGAKHAD